ncbi:MAG: Holliday junction resolvase RuvX [Actinomycetaceae bacterium]|nr:Holliday junction resolvase RuvX [Arcanobacterium sp.]MDD7504825.1 Holliday junction resolvase RuvX [Actinomycetaceae bacterium]MDY6143673.1 Holliday junction resolvase RuvX [Arcanobacterium sp.]
MRTGIRIAVDVGQVRVGVAKSDSDAILALPVATLKRYQRDIPQVARLARELAALEVYVGLPLNMDGREGANAKDARKWARKLQAIIAPIPVRLVDERLSSVSAHNHLHAAGRRAVHHRAVVDQEAAVIILESALSAERDFGNIPGIALEGDES